MSLLILRNLLKTFGGLVAMNSVTFSVDEASIVGLIGPNGAGKTTTFNIITGNYRPDQRLLEIARALASEPRFLILDEPAGGMNDQETADLMLLIKAIQKRGITILLIEHDMNLVMRVCEKIVVLENGALIAEGTSAEIKRNPRVIEAYLGAEG